ncbi:MAG: folylpolyglutamate synthase/dihydrofolate synthase family protein [Schaedlerella sp.]|nr:folylpolyglutamate synthase/dihydrofolate synthase family protein [Schaedlerella sp.]
MTYKEARVYLDNVSKYGSVLGLDTIRNLLNELGNPQDELKFIHIAGTNGKGSTLSFISTILSEAGYKTGKYSSPAVMSYLEMIQVNGEWISEEDFAELVEKVKRAIARMETKGQNSPTIFEVETAIAFLYFNKKQCDYVVLETGLGGDEDATNVVGNTKAAVFAPISKDHMGILGDTVEEIAWKKAGIIKPGCVVISAKQEESVQRILQKRAEQLGCRIIFAEPEKIVVEKSDYKGSCFSYKNWKNLKINLSGNYQMINAATVLEFADSNVVAGLSEDNIKRGLLKTEWPGRFQCICEEPIIVIDGAHNEDAAKRLRESMELYFHDKKKIFICGVFKDKAYEKIAQIMAPLAEKIYTVDLPNEQRTLDSEQLGKTMQKYCKESCQVYAVSNIEKAVQKACSEMCEEAVILAFGSLSYLKNIIQCVNKNMREKYDR